MDDCKILDVGNDISQEDFLHQNHDAATNSIAESTTSKGVHKNVLNETLDDFQENEIGRKLKSKFAEKSQADSAFVCIMCQGDFTHLTLKERSVHVNQCIDYHSSPVATSQTNTPAVFVLECPLCSKQLSSNEERMSHVKKCGKSRGLSMQSVIQAIQLQEKHVLERKALGLPLNVKAKQAKLPKKPVVKKTALQPKNAMQSDLQLAKALSLSLKENESQSQLLILPTGTEDVSIEVLKPPKEFQKPGKILSKKKKAITDTPLLLLRTEEERKKIIQDKVDTIVALSLKSQKDLALTEQRKSTEDQNAAYLWNLSATVADKSSYYVEQLLDWIQPSDVEIGSKLCNLSQIPGHRIFTQLPCDYTFSCSNKSNVPDELSESSTPSSLSSSLRSLIGNSWMSDVDIHTASGIVIPAHKLFLALRCPSLKNAFDHPIECGKYILNWENTSFDAALHFLNFIYTGSTEWKDEVIEELTQLARKYKVDDLLNILSDSKTLDMLISEDLENDEQATIAPMDSEFCYKGEENVDCCFLNKVQSDLDTKQNATYSFGKDDHSGVEDNIEMPFSNDSKLDVESKCNNFSHSPSVTHLLTASTSDRVVKDVPRDMTTNHPDHCPESSIIDNSSSNDSCKIISTVSLEVKTSPSKHSDSCIIQNDLSPKAYPIDKTSTIIPQHSPCSSSKYYFIRKENSPISSFLNVCRKISDNSFSSKLYEPTPPKLDDENVNDDNSNEVFIVKEITDKTDRISWRNSSSSDDTMPLESVSCQKLTNFSSVFQTGHEDLDAAICFSQNASFQDSIRSNSLICNQSPTVSKKSLYVSPEKTELNRKWNEQNFIKGISPIKNNNFKNELSNSSKADVILNNDEYEESRISSPEILICNSEDEDSEQVLDRNYFQNYEASSQTLSSPPRNKLNSLTDEIVEEIKNFDDEFPSFTTICNKPKVKSLSEESDVVIDESFILQHDSISKHGSPPCKTTVTNFISKSPQSLKKIIPEIIYCDSNSGEKLEVVDSSPKRMQNLSESPGSSSSSSNTDCESKPMGNEDNDCVSILPNSVSPQLEKPETISICKNLLLLSPDSPWILRTNKSLEDSGAPKILKKSCKSSTSDPSVSQKHSDKNLNKLKTTTSSITTPKDLVKFKISESPITPLPDYSNMKTPEIKDALKKIGVKALPRKKAVAVLSHIYDETHPWNDGMPCSSRPNLESSSQSMGHSLTPKKALSLPKKRKGTAEMCEGEAKKKANKCNDLVKNLNKVQDKAARKTTKGSSACRIKKSDNLETQKNFSSCDTSSENIASTSFGSNNSRGETQNLSLSSEFSDNGLTDCKETTALIKNYILSNNELYSKILSYTPVNLVELQQELKENCIKIGIKQLTDYLDEQCITFTYPRKEEYKKKQQARTQRFRKRMIAQLSQKES